MIIAIYQVRRGCDAHLPQGQGLREGVRRRKNQVSEH